MQIRLRAARVCFFGTASLIMQHGSCTDAFIHGRHAVERTKNSVFRWTGLELHRLLLVEIGLSETKLW